MKLSDISKKMILMIGVSSLIFIAAGLAYYRSASVFPFIYGLLLVAALNAVKVIMLEHVVTKAVDMDGKVAGGYAGLQYLLRFLLTGVVLAFAAISPHVNLWGAVCGIFTLQIAAISMKFFFGRDENTASAVNTKNTINTADTENVESTKGTESADE